MLQLETIKESEEASRAMTRPYLYSKSTLEHSCRRCNLNHFHESEQMLHCTILLKAATRLTLLAPHSSIVTFYLLKVMAKKIQNKNKTKTKMEKINMRYENLIYEKLHHKTF